MRFCTIDIIADLEDILYVLEVNTSVCISNYIEQQKDGYRDAENIYKKAILKMFE